MTESSTREQVKAEIIGAMEEAERTGRDLFAWAAATFPGTPDMILGECYAEMAMNEAEA